MKYIKKFNDDNQKETYIKNNYIDPALYKTNNNVQYVKKAGNYIQDGLIFQFDGKYKGSYENILTDMISGKHAVSYKFNETTNKFEYKHNSDNLEIINTSLYDARIEYDNDFPYSTDYTVEICFKADIPSNNKIVMFSCGGDNTPAFVLYTKSIMFIQKQNQYITPNNDVLKDYKMYTFSLNLDHGYCNKQELTQTSADWWNSGDANKIYLFNGHNGKVYNVGLHANIYAIRIYNRRLTQEEQLNNQDVDIKRFNIESEA